MEQIFDILILTIKYGIWVYLGIDILLKLAYLGVVKKRLGKGYKTIPETKPYSSIRLTSIFLSGVLFVLLLTATLLNGTAIHIPFIALLLATSLYLGGKYQHSFGLNGTLFYSNSGYIIYKPGFIIPFSGIKLRKWETLEKVIWKRNYPFSKWRANFYLKGRNGPIVLMTGRYTQLKIDKLLGQKKIESICKRKKSTSRDGSVPDTYINLN